ncbi:hypothetical protein LCGC14_0245630 [marine sediment metagenome]|uniref:Uncharacterized protein n=1 Tax=marine sediment metagenome TaxID=412755 RepID=A0A0F9UMD8_9ZZZZ
MTRKKFLVSVLILIGAGLTIVTSLWKKRRLTAGHDNRLDVPGLGGKTFTLPFKKEWTASPHEVRLWYCYSKDDGTWSDPVPFEEEIYNFNINN